MAKSKTPACSFPRAVPTRPKIVERSFLQSLGNKRLWRLCVCREIIRGGNGAGLYDIYLKDLCIIGCEGIEHDIKPGGRRGPVRETREGVTESRAVFVSVITVATRGSSASDDSTNYRRIVEAMDGS